ncbi:3-oxoacyl-ACP synthase III [Agilicoccus flavus]|uniref:3-oxoacyl-ACP synthase III n=1 Tax=Agilicoccus flavus TaxID=2775968 RepID=UPI001CF66C2F|nr:3-oxoacyl-ACP synthase III [Agilicoccus flavus]
MTGNATFHPRDTAIHGVEMIEAPEVVTSDEIDEMLAPVYRSVKMSPGAIEELAGVRERRWWPKEKDFVEGAVDAGRLVLERTGVDPSRIGLVVNASVTRPHLEPAIAARVHHELGLRSNCIAFDITNACLAVVNAIQVAGTMIDAGQIEYALVVASEGMRGPQEATIARLVAGSPSRQDVKDAFATFTLGSGAVGVLVGRASEGGHRVVGGVTRAGSEHHELCIGSMDGMVTDGRRLFVEGIGLAIETWRDAQQTFDWSDMDAYVAHQTSTAHIDSLCQALGLPREKFPLTIPTFGNIGPAALPFTLARVAPDYSAGDRVLLMGIGSGLNTAFLEIEW